MTASTEWITIRDAFANNLRHVDVRLPRQALVVVTGVSGSGKSSLVFDTIVREAQRRYLETFSSQARQVVARLGQPAVGEVDGLGPVVAVDQRTVVRTPRSTVGTLSGVYDLLRLLVARLGIGEPGEFGPPWRRSMLSFNSPEGWCPACRGLGVEDRLDPELLVADASRSIRGRALAVTTPNGYLMYSQVTLPVLDTVCRAHGFTIDTPWQDLTEAQRRVVLFGSDAVRVPYGKHPLESRLRWTGITPRPRQEGVYKGIVPVMEGILQRERNPSVLRFCRTGPCRACGGLRLRPEALAVRLHGRSIADLARLEVEALDAWIRALAWEAGQAEVGAPIRNELLGRTALLGELGLGYLTLDRASPTLSGGEAQRLRLASLAMVGLRGLLIVLDEPTVGLHPRDAARLVAFLRRLRDGGNSVIVVEHDPMVWAAADWIVELGPGAGPAGGQVLWNGEAGERGEGRGESGEAGERAEGRGESGKAGERAEGRGESGEAGERAEGRGQSGEAGGAPLRSFAPSERESECSSAGPPTHNARGWVDSPPSPLPSPLRSPTWLHASGLTRNNLRGIDVSLAVGGLNVVTGVSGAGKSSLAEALVERLERGELQGDVVPARALVVDQAPIGRTPRSNPATYTGAFDLVRDLFARQPEAKARGLERRHFSFNLAGGRCEACEGAGVEEVGMHFLGSVELPCEACGGTRFGPETLAVTWRGRSIAEVLAMPVSEAVGFFSDQPRLARMLAALQELGLGYVTLGQPSPTLSGGEAQRVKLASELGKDDARPTLFVLDEPTVGLHPLDVQVLLAALRRLAGAGHTVLVVEHDPDVVRAADHVIDLGPEGGAAGGAVLATGPPDVVAACEGSHTGAALRALAEGRLWSPPAGPDTAAARDAWDAPVELRGVRTHNLAGLDVTIPSGKLTVITGVSGSGKSSLAFDTVHGEAKRRFLECLPTAVRTALGQVGEADLDGATGLFASLGVRQQRPARNPRSTVGTLTGAAELLRLLYARAGTRHCPGCGAALDGHVCPGCGFQGIDPLWAWHFSPSNQHTACAVCHGLGFARRCEPGRLVTHPERPLGAGAMDGTRIGRFFGEPDGQHVAALLAVGRELGIDFGRPWLELDADARDVAMRGAGERTIEVEWRFRRGKREGVHRFTGRWDGFCRLVETEYARVHADARGEAIESLLAEQPCPACGGGCLQPELLAVRFAGRSIAEAAAMPARAARAWLAEVDTAPDRLGVAPREATVSAAVRAPLAQRLAQLESVGLGYLSMDRRAATLSGGEAQRVRLAALPGCGLVGLLAVLDEPTTGLHPRDTAELVTLLRSLRDSGNTVVVVEHDPAVIVAADHVIELGPGAGAEGGRIVAAGAPAALIADPASLTGPHLSPRRRTARPRRPLRPGVRVRGARANNLQGFDVAIPAGGLVAVTGVSGSGKSTLVFDVLAASLQHLPRVQPVGCDGVELAAPFSAVLAAGLGGLAPSPHSSPGSLTGVLDHLRAALARTPEARQGGLKPGHFSTSAPGGRCETCEGLGQVRVSMDFLADVWVRCETCQGARFRPEVLACRLRGRTIVELLDAPLAGVGSLFADEPGVAAPLTLLAELGLGYLHLGQPVTTLSGGERQRLELGLELLTPGAGGRLVLLDEPTRGLHPADVERLLALLDRLVDAGHSLVVVEHDLQLVAAADWVVDLGPDGGDEGGRIVVAGHPEEVAACPASHTGRALATVL